jgi:hypothetical protein
MKRERENICMGYTPQVFSLHASGVAGMLDGVGGIMDLL